MFSQASSTAAQGAAKTLQHLDHTCCNHLECTLAQTDMLFASLQHCCLNMQQYSGSNTHATWQPHTRSNRLNCTSAQTHCLSKWPALQYEQHNRLCMCMHPVRSLLVLLCSATALSFDRQRHTSISFVHLHIHLHIHLHMMLYIIIICLALL